MLKPILFVLGLLLISPSPASAAEDFDGKHTVPAGTKGGNFKIGSLLSEGEITLGAGCINYDIELSGSTKDLEGLITISSGCKDIDIVIGDSWDTTGKIVIGDNCEVEIKCGSDFHGNLVVGRNCKVVVSYSDSAGGNITKDPSSTVDIRGPKG